MEAPHAGTIASGIGVEAVGIQQQAEQGEHGALMGWWDLQDHRTPMQFVDRWFSANGMDQERRRCIIAMRTGRPTGWPVTGRSTGSV